MPKDYDLTPDYVEAYQRGENDCNSDKPKSSNPHKFDSDEKKQGWLDGWNSAAKGH